MRCAPCFLAAVLALCLAAPARADSRACDGPPECCPEKTAGLSKPATLGLSVILVALSNINERAGTWDADFYFVEKWSPTPGFFPRSEIVNELSRNSEQFDTVELTDGQCNRSRRIRSTLRNSYNLRSFPFDSQKLEIQVSDATYDAKELVYAPNADAANIDKAAREQLSSWMLEGPMTYRRTARIWEGTGETNDFEYATFQIPVKRHVTFHLTKFFLPLLFIVAIAFSVFWIAASELSTQAAIGVTCLLAAIAFQFAEAANLPEVAYLTLADRIYAASYVAVSLAFIVTVRASALLRAGKPEAADRLLRRSRLVFPLGMVLAVVLAVIPPLWR